MESVNQAQVKIYFFTSGTVMWVFLLKYVVMIRAEPERSIQLSIQQSVMRFRENKLF